MKVLFSLDFYVYLRFVRLYVYVFVCDGVCGKIVLQL